MRKCAVITIVLIAIGVILPSCVKNDLDKYNDWYKQNQEWLVKQSQMIDPKTGKLFYDKVYAPYDDDAFIYMHFFNDRELTKNNLCPLYTSTVDIKYIGRDCEGVAFDSSFNRRVYGDSIMRSQVNQFVAGFTLALQKMHVGDSCRVIIPYELGYGTVGNTTLRPFTTLEFDIKMVDVVKYQAKSK